jgi:hypothetical protein
MINLEECFRYDFGRYPKAKYILMLDGEQRYYFITTLRSEEESIKALKEKIKDLYYINTRSYKIIKKTKEYEKVLEKGKF